MGSGTSFVSTNTQSGLNTEKWGGQKGQIPQIVRRFVLIFEVHAAGHAQLYQVSQQQLGDPLNMQPSQAAGLGQDEALTWLFFGWYGPAVPVRCLPKEKTIIS